MSKKYYIRFRGKVQGPFSVARLRVLATRRRFGRHYEVSTDRVHWTSAKEYPELFSSPKTSPSVYEPQPQEAEIESEPGAQEDDAQPDVALAQDDQQWYYMQDEQQLGPVGTEELRSMAELGSITAETYVWKDGFDEWVPAFQVPKLLPDHATVGLTSGGSRARSRSGRRRINYEKLFLRIVLGGLVLAFLTGVGIFLFKQFTSVVKEIAVTSDQDGLSETGVSPFAQPGLAAPSAPENAAAVRQSDESDPETILSEEPSSDDEMKPEKSSTSEDEPSAPQPRQPEMSAVADKILGEWSDSKGYVTLKLAPGGSGFLFLFSEGGGSGPVDTGPIKWKPAGEKFTFYGSVGNGTGVLQENGTEIRMTMEGVEFVLTRQ